MSMQVTIREDDIAEAIWRGDLGLADLIETLRLGAMSNSEFAEFVANDISAFLDTSSLKHEPVIEFFGTIQSAAEALIEAEQEAAQ